MGWLVLAAGTAAATPNFTLRERGQQRRIFGIILSFAATTTTMAPSDSSSSASSSSSEDKHSSSELEEQRPQRGKNPSGEELAMLAHREQQEKK